MALGVIYLPCKYMFGKNILVNMLNDSQSSLHTISEFIL